VSQDRRLANRGPRPADIGNQKEPAFVKEPQMGPKSFGLFLYAATREPSTPGFFPRPVARRVSRVSGNSISTLPGAISKPRHPCIRLHTASRSHRRSASTSIAPCCARPPWHLSTIAPAGPPFVRTSDVPACPTGCAGAIPSFLSPGVSDSTGSCYSRTLSRLRPRPERFVPSVTRPRLGTDAFPADRAFHGVSCHG
jgi:hypothetical protein